MKHKALGSQGGARTFLAVFDMEDDVLGALQRLCDGEQLLTARLSGIGGFRSATVGYYDMDEQRYEAIHVNEQVEVLSMLGNVTAYQGRPKIHAHCVLGHRDGRTTGGHLLAGIVRPTLELLVEELPAVLHRRDRPEIGIPLIEL